MANRVVKVRRETIEACITCLLCSKLLREATTISECLHTFCRKCIYEKISDEELESCPICNIDLGCVPLEKLRPDHSLQDVRAKIFPFKRRKVKAPELLSVTLPVRRKERSLSSLVVNTPRVSSETAMTERTRGVARKASALRSSSFSDEKPVKNEEIFTQNRPESSSSPEFGNKFNKNARRISFPGKPSEALPVKKTENGYNPLNFLAEAANITKSFKLSSQDSDAKLKPSPIADRETQVRRIRRKSKVMDENHVDPANLELEKPNKFSRIWCRRRATSEELGANYERRIGPIWFSLVASEDQEGNVPLPQIPVSYLRIKDGNIPVSFVQKYLMRKLNLESETEVEIKCMGEAVGSSLQVFNLVDLWLQSSSQCIQACIGSSAKDFVMVLSYSRKV